MTLQTLLLLQLLALLMATEVTAAVCVSNIDDPVEVASNNLYLVKDCCPPNTSVIGNYQRNASFMTFYSNSTTSPTLSNVTIVVKRGCVLPSLLVDSGALDGVTVIVRDVVVPADGMRTITVSQRDSTERLRSILRVGPKCQQINNINVTLDNTTILLEYSVITPTNDTFNRSRISVAATGSLLLAINSEQVYRTTESATNVQNVSVHVRRSNISYTLGGNVNYVTAGLVSIVGGSQFNNTMRSVQVHVEGFSNLLVVANTSYVYGDYSNTNPAMFLVGCVSNAMQWCHMQCITMRTIGEDGATQRMLQYAPGISYDPIKAVNDPNDESATLISLSGFSSGSDFTVDVQSVNVSVASTCSGPAVACDTSTLDQNSKIGLRAQVVVIEGVKKPTNASLVNVNASILNCTVLLDGPKTAIVLSMAYAKELHGVVAVVKGLTATLRGDGNISVGMVTRNVGVLEVDHVNNASSVLAQVSDSNVHVESAPSGCIISFGFVVSLLGNVSHSIVNVSNVDMSHWAVPQTANNTAFYMSLAILQYQIAFQTVLSTLVNVAPQDPTSMTTGVNITVIVLSSSIMALHAVNLPPDNAQLQRIVLCAVAAINLQRSLNTASIALEDVHVRRQFAPTQLSTGAAVAGPASWFPASINGLRGNITTLVLYYDLMSTISGTVPSFFYAALIDTSLAATSIIHTNVHTTATNNCTVAYAVAEGDLMGPSSPSESPSATDLLSFIVLPAESIASTYVVNGSSSQLSTMGETSGETNVSNNNNNGSLVSTLGSAALVNSTVEVRHIQHRAGMSRLLTAYFKTLLFNVSSSIHVDDCSFSVASDRLTSTAAYGVVGNGAMIVLDLSTDTTSSTIKAENCNFLGGFTKLFLTSTMAIAKQPSSAVVDSVELGCNLWDGKAMPRSALFSDDSVTWIASTKYLLSTFSAGPAAKSDGIVEEIVCPGLDVTATRTAVVEPPPSTNAPPAVPPAAVNTVTSVVGVVGSVTSALVDVQVLVAMGQSVCAPTALRESTSASQFLMSPFYPLGSLAMVFGNIGIFLVLHGLHRFLVYSRRRTLQSSMSANVFPVLADATAASPPSSLHAAVQLPPLQTSGSVAPRRRVTLRAEVGLKFPNYSMTIAMQLAAGVAVGGVRGLSSGDVADTVAGVVAFAAVTASVWWRVRAGKSSTARRMQFFLYRHNVRQSFVAPWALPLGLWGPPALRATHGRLRGAVRPGAEWLSALALTAALTVQGVASIPVPQSWCVGLWFVLCAVQVAAISCVVYFRPARAPLSDVFQAASLMTAAAIQVVAGLSAAGVASASLTTLTSSLSIVAMAVSMCKAAHVAVMFLWERHQQRHMSRNKDNIDVDGENLVDFVLPALLMLHRSGGSTFMDDGGSAAGDGSGIGRRRKRHVSELDKAKMLRRLVEAICHDSRKQRSRYGKEGTPT